MALQQQIQAPIRFNLEKSKAQLRLLTDFNLHQLLLAVYAEQDRRDKEWGFPIGKEDEFRKGYLERKARTI